MQNTVNDPCQAAPILLSTPSVPGWCSAAEGVLNGNGSLSRVLAGVAGVMGLPDPYQARVTIAQNVGAASDTPDLFVTNPTLYSLELGNVSDRVATTINSQTILSTQGQQQTQNQIDQTTQAVQDIATSSDNAQSATSTQDVVKAIAKINAQQSIMAAMAQVSTLKARTDTQFTNLNLTNISNSLDQQNRQRQAAYNVDGYMLLNLSAQSNLF